jgi:hypothetical protein
MLRPAIMDAPLREPLDSAGLSTAQAADRLALTTTIYLAAVEVAKRALVRRGRLATA